MTASGPRGRVHRRLLRLGIIASCATAVWTPAPVAGQMEGCAFGERGRNDGYRSPELGGVWYIGDPHFVCDDGSQIFADSVVIYEDRGRNDLIGNVRYYAGSRQLFADDARYFTREGRMQASGNVRVIDEERGSTIENGDLVLLMANGTRTEEEMTVTTGADGIRPLAVMLPPPPSESPVDPTAVEEVSVDSVAPADTVPPTPYEVESDRMQILGSGSFVAVGDVEIVRDSLFAWADSADYDGEAGGLDLAGSARVESAAYLLEGETIRMGAPGSAESKVEARRSAHLSGEDIDLTSALITMFLRNDQLERLVATPIFLGSGPDVETGTDSIAAERPVAEVETFHLTADSLDVTIPNERIERVFAAGAARSESTAGDSLNVELLPEMARNDWLEGDTIIIAFEPAADGADDDEMTVQSVQATSSARSLYRLPSNDSTAVPGVDPPAVHYVTGQQITIRMDEGEISDMEVIGQTRGVHLEPLARAARSSQQDTTGVDSLATDTLAIDTTGVGVDTTAARVDTMTVQPSGASSPSSNPQQPADGDARRPEDTPWIRP